MVRIRSLLILLTFATALAGCNAPAVRRDAETLRFRAEMQRQIDKLELKPGVPLTMDQCEKYALQNSLDLRVRELTLKLQDDQVRLAFAGFLPKLSAEYDWLDRNNNPDIHVNFPGAPAGGETFSFQNKRQESFVFNGMVPVLDWGIAYYSFQTAIDRRRQGQFLLERTKQVLRRDVKIAYARYAGAIRQERLAQVANQAAQQVLRVARNLEREDMTVHADTVLIEAAVAQTVLELSLAQRRVEEMRLTLSQFMSVPPTLQFTIINELPPVPPPPTAQQVAEYDDRALAVRPELAVQDIQRHISSNAVRRAAAEFFPRIDAIGSFNWSNASVLVNPAYFGYGFRVSSALLDGGATIFRFKLAKKSAEVEKASSTLLSLGILYDVELRAMRVRQAWETARAAEVYDRSRRLALKRTIDLYKEGMEDEATTAQAIQNLTIQATALDAAQTNYLVAWYELEAAALPASSPTTRPTTHPSTRPALPSWMVLPGSMINTVQP